jgi:hypothetical protein
MGGFPDAAFVVAMKPGYPISPATSGTIYGAGLGQVSLNEPFKFSYSTLKIRLGLP